MNELERVVSTLVRSIESNFPNYLAGSFRVHELHEQLIPYKIHRNELGVETNEYYELALTRLLSGEGGYVLAPDELRSALKSELQSPNPDSARFKDFGNVDVKLSELALTVPARVASAVTGALAPVPVINASEKPKPTPQDSVAEAIRITTSSPTPAITAAIRSEMKAPPAPKRSRSPSARSPSGSPTASSKEKKMPSSQRTTNSAALGGTCRYCHGVLPEGRDLTYCPHCGQDLTVHHCPACSTELEVGWKFCVTCGRSVEE